MVAPAEQEAVADRAVEIVKIFAEALLPLSPEARGQLWMLLCTESGREFAVRFVRDQYGYVSEDPAGFARLWIERHRYDGIGVPWPSAV